jgi:hypothetical protein
MVKIPHPLSLSLWQREREDKIFRGGLEGRSPSYIPSPLSLQGEGDKGGKVVVIKEFLWIKATPPPRLSMAFLSHPSSPPGKVDTDGEAER